MSVPITTTSIQIPAPVLGVNFKDPLVDMDPRYSPWMLNWTPEAGYVETRKPWERHQAPVASPGYIIGLGAWYGGTKKLFALVQEGVAGKTEIWDVTGTPSRVVGPMATGTSNECHPAYYNGQLALATELESEIYYYNGSAWTQLGFTDGANPISGRTMVGYKGRVYIFYNQLMYYTNTVGAVSGACTSYNLADILESPSNIWWAGVLSSPGDRASELYLACGTQDGEVLVYGGSYPGGADWTLVSRFKISPVPTYNSILVYRNDIWILTTTGIVSLRDLMAKGSIAAEDLTVSQMIDPYWRDLVGRLTTTQSYGVKAVFWPEQNKVYVMVPGGLTYSAGASVYDASSVTFFVYNCLTQAWGVHQVTCWNGEEAGGLTYFNNNLYAFTNASGSDSYVMKIETAGTSTGAYQDQDAFAGTYVPIPVPLDGAPVNFGRRRQVHGFEPTVYSLDTGSALSMAAVADYGRAASNGAAVALASGYSVPWYGAGIQCKTAGGYRIQGNRGTTHTDHGGIKLFNVGLVVS